MKLDVVDMMGDPIEIGDVLSYGPITRVQVMGVRMSSGIVEILCRELSSGKSTWRSPDTSIRLGRKTPTTGSVPR